MAAGAVSGTLAACSTTQDKAARLRVNAARIRASQKETKVTVTASTLTVSRLALVKSGRRTAFVVSVGNPSSSPVSDLPISVGYQSGQRAPVYLNAGASGTYFQAHLPVVPGHGAITWVFTTRRRVPSRARPFAKLGARSAIPVALPSSLPTISAKLLAVKDGAAALAVKNLSGLPQYQLQVYGVAHDGTRYVAAGSHTVKDLESHASQTLKLRLVGNAPPGRLSVVAIPTIFH